MKPFSLEYLKFTVAEGFSVAAPAFSSLRKAVANGGATEQYYGITQDDKDQLIWVINWPGSAPPEEFKNDSSDFRKSVSALDVNSKPTSWLIPFRFEEEVKPALTAPVTEFASIVLQDASKKDSIIDSLHRTFSDCYYTKGFSGGSWGIATNDPRVCMYVLGWEERAHHTSYAQSPVFALEIDNLKAHFAPGTAGVFAQLTKESS